MLDAQHRKHCKLIEICFSNCSQQVCLVDHLPTMIRRYSTLPNEKNLDCFFIELMQTRALIHQELRISCLTSSGSFLPNGYVHVYDLSVSL